MMYYDLLNDGAVMEWEHSEGMSVTMIRHAPEDDTHAAAMTAYNAQETAGWTTYTLPTPAQGQTAPWSVPLPNNLPAGSRLLVAIETGAVTTVEGADLNAPVVLGDSGPYKVWLVTPEPNRGSSIQVELL